MADMNEVLSGVFEMLVNRLTDVERKQDELVQRVDGALAAASLAERLREQRAQEFMVQYDGMSDDDFGFYYVDNPIVAGHAPSTVGLRMEDGKRLRASNKPGWCCPLPRAKIARVWLHVAAEGFDWAAQKEALKTFVKAHSFLDFVRISVVSEEEQATYSEALPTRVSFDVSIDYYSPHRFWDELLAAALDTAAAIGCVCDSRECWVELMAEDEPLWLGEVVFHLNW